MVEGQLHPSASIEEKASLSDQWLSFHPFKQDRYLMVIEPPLKEINLEMTSNARSEALRFATRRGSKSSRIATQFAAR
ncbi:MAG: putative AAA+ superfamily ATPase [Gammaproteobacteria bacterium]|jgi:predicted AAA+ superfamily ATPase